MFILNIGLSPNYTALKHRRQQSSIKNEMRKIRKGAALAFSKLLSLYDSGETKEYHDNLKS
jgi:hypothetical protein